MSNFFITATGTEIGKTHITADVVRHLRAAGSMARAIKPVASGYDPTQPQASDAGMLLAAMGEPPSDPAIARICPWRFAAPLSPHMAAAREGRLIDFDQLLHFCRDNFGQESMPLFIEGVGGAMVPLDNNHTVRDWIAELSVPAIVVAGAYLGAISHTLCTIEALRARGVTILAVVVNARGPSPVPVSETVATIERHCGESRIQVAEYGATNWWSFVGR